MSSPHSMEKGTIPPWPYLISLVLIVNVPFLGFLVRLLIIVQIRKTPGRVDSGTHFERSPSQNMRTQLKFDRNYGLTWEIACG